MGYSDVMENMPSVRQMSLALALENDFDGIIFYHVLFCFSYRNLRKIVFTGYAM